MKDVPVEKIENNEAQDKKEIVVRSGPNVKDILIKVGIGLGIAITVVGAVIGIGAIMKED